MRIVSGIYGGRRLNVSKGRDIRPTSDKVRGAIFNALESRGAVRDASVIDCFCGTGALGFEALSRGAQYCTFIDKARSSLELARQNGRDFDIETEAHFILKDATNLAMRPSGLKPATLVFLDPPYGKGLAFSALHTLKEKGWLASDAILVLEVEKEFSGPVPEGVQLFDEKTYGETKILFLRS